MPIPLPDADHRDRSRPDAAQTELIARGLAGAAAGASGLTPLQRVLIESVCRSMTGHGVDVDADPVGPRELAIGLAARDLAFRTRIVQLMILTALVVRPLPESVADRVGEFAAELGVDDGMLDVVRDFAHGSFGLAAVDFDRNGYTRDWEHHDRAVLHTAAELHAAWAACDHDPDLAARWRALERLPVDTLGRRVSELYRARGFEYPGDPGSAPPLLAQHDWVHVLADYGTRVESELEVFAIIARANDDPRGFGLLAMVVSLFETGALGRGAGLFEASPGQLSLPGMATRVADAMRRGALVSGSVDFLAVDWFELADLPLVSAQEHFGMVPKAADALAAGSVGPWEIGGISEFQMAQGRRSADARGRPYRSFGATLR